MTNDKLKLFNSEDDIKSYARVNGYDAGGIDDLIKRWKELDNDIEEINNAVKNTIILSSNMEYK